MNARLKRIGCQQGVEFGIGLTTQDRSLAWIAINLGVQSLGNSFRQMGSAERNDGTQRYTHIPLTIRSLPIE